MALGINVDGTHHVIPGVLSIIDVSELVDPPSFPTGRIALLGEGTGLLQPGTPHKVVASQSNITSILQPGDLRNGALMAINPSPELNGTPELYLVPVNPAVRSSYALKDGSNATLLTLTSQGYGAKYNDLKVSYTTATKVLELVLDNVTEAYLVGAGGTALADLVASINAQSDLVTAALTIEGTIAQIAAQSFTSGANGTTTDQHWQDALGQLTSLDVNLVVCLTEDTTVHGYLATHCNATKRRGFFGYNEAANSWRVYANRATNITTLKTNRALSVSNSGEPRMLCPAIGGKFQSTFYPSKIVAAMYAGVAALVPPTRPLTNIPLNLGELEVELDDAEVGDLITSGFAVPMRNHGPTRQGFVISHQHTSWVGDDNLSRIEFSVGRGVDAIQRAVVEELWQFVGEEGVAEVPARAVFVTNKLLQRAASGIDFIRIVTFNQRATRAELLGTILRVFFEYTPILPVNFVIAYAKLKRTSLVAQMTDSFDISLSGLGGTLDQTVSV